MIKRAMIAGIVSAGATVHDLSALPVPVTQYATRHSASGAGIHVLSSPLDQRSADIRFFDAQGMALDRRAERRLENLFFREDFRRASFYEIGDIEYATPLRAYVDHVLSGIDVEAIRRAKLRVLVDYDFSSSSIVLPEILNTLDVSAISLHIGFSEDHRPRASTDEAALIARTVAADVGCVLGSTGERLSLIDEGGTVLKGHEALGVVAAMVLMDGPAAIAVPASAPQWLVDAVVDRGGEARSTKSDPASVLRGAVEAGARLAGDGAGGMAWPEHLGAYDAVYTLVKVLELRARHGKALGDVRAGLPQTHHLTATEFCPWEVKGRVLRVLLAEHAGDNIDLVDGIKIFVDGGFVLVQPDPDAPMYHVAVSHRDADEARRLLDEFSRRVRDAEGSTAENDVPMVDRLAPA